MTKQTDDFEMSDDLGPDVCPDGISQAMSIRDYPWFCEEMEIETGITLGVAGLGEDDNFSSIGVISDEELHFG